jgi:predicted TIM-barrel fold metal-dependent hydrolase
MFSKRTSTQAGSETENDSDYEERPPPKRFKHDAQPLGRVKVYVVQAKLTAEEIQELFRLVEDNCEKLCRIVEEADVVVTNVRMRRRLERHIDWRLAVGFQRIFDVVCFSIDILVQP